MRPSLCRPANASVLCSDHGVKSIAHAVSLVSCLALMLSVSMSNSGAEIDVLNHLAISGDVFVRSCPSVLAVITTRAPRWQDMAQFAIMPISADLPIPCPEATAIFSGVCRVAGSARCVAISSSISACQTRRSLFLRSPWPHPHAVSAHSKGS